MQSLQPLLISDQYFRWNKVAYVKLCKGTQVTGVTNTEFFIWKKRQLKNLECHRQGDWLSDSFLMQGLGAIRWNYKKPGVNPRAVSPPSPLFYPRAAVLRKTSKWKFINSECNKMDLTVSRIQREFDSMGVKLCAGKWRMWKNGVFFNIEKSLGIMPGNTVNKGWEKLMGKAPSPHATLSCQSMADCLKEWLLS